MLLGGAKLMGTPDVMSQAPQLVLIKFLAALANYTPNCFYTYYAMLTHRGGTTGAV